MYFLRKNNQHEHRYNAPLIAECGAIIVLKGRCPLDYDICVYPENEDNQLSHTYISKLSHLSDSMVFPLLLPNGDLGWSTGHKQNPSSSKQLSILQYYSNRLAYRPNIFNSLISAERLTLQY